MNEVLERIFSESFNNIIREENKLKIKRKSVLTVNIDMKKSKDLTMNEQKLKNNKILISFIFNKIISLNSILFRKTLRDLLISLNHKYKITAGNQNKNNT